MRGDNLAPTSWRFSGSLPAVTKLLSVDRDQKVVFFVSTKGSLVGIDLNARNAQVRVPLARQLVGSTDGMVFGLDSSRRAIRFATRGLTTYKTKLIDGPLQLFRAPGGQVSVFSGTQHLVQVLGEGGEVRRFDVPDGTAANSWFGDLIAISNDSGVTLVEQTPTRNGVSFIKVRGTPLGSTFSPSGHRIYTALGNGKISVIDRFARSVISQVTLPGIATHLRVDRNGRWLMVAPEKGDSIWLVDLLHGQVVAQYASPWRDDLPEVLDGTRLLLRQGKDVVVYSLEGPTPVEKQRLSQAAADILVPLYWLPGRKGAAAGVTATASRVESPAAAAPVPEALAVKGREPEPAAAKALVEAWYLQVSSSQNQSFSQALAEQLAGAGYPAKVVPPQTADQGFRVILGPYPSHDAADSVGKRLGRAYFVMMLDPPER